MEANFKPIDYSIACRLTDLICLKNLNKSFEIEGKTYTLVYISHHSDAYYRSRSLSAYFKVDRSIVRISDHWSKSVGFERSRKLNCGFVSGKRWNIGKGARKMSHFWRAGKYPWVLLAGICGLSALNKTCDHFKPESKKDKRHESDMPTDYEIYEEVLSA